MIQSISGVLCCGNISYDIPVWPVDKFEWGTTLWVERIESCVGGNGGNTSYALAKMGTPVKLFGMTGQDEHGDQVLNILQKAGVDIGGVRRTSSPTNSSICVIHSSGDRLFLHRLGASVDVTSGMLDLKSSPTASHFHLANLFSLPHIRATAPSVLRRAHEAGLTTSLDTGWDARGKWMEDVAPCLPHVDLLFVNESEAHMLTQSERSAEVAAVLRRDGATDIVLKLGAAGCVLFFEDQQIALPGFPIRALDTTGAGDSFAGGFLSALHRGYDYPRSARFANAVGALNSEKLGAVGGVLGFPETLAWMEERQRITLERV
jgi:sugar/nucleoside kinase (ribokinase family)